MVAHLSAQEVETQVPEKRGRRAPFFVQPCVMAFLGGPGVKLF